MRSTGYASPYKFIFYGRFKLFFFLLLIVTPNKHFFRLNEANPRCDFFGSRVMVPAGFVMVFWTDVSKFYVRALYPFEFRLVKSGKVSLVKYEADLKLCVSKIKKK